MRTLMVSLVALLVVSGLVCNSLWRDLQAEKRTTANLRTQIEEPAVTAEAQPPAMAAVSPAYGQHPSTCGPDSWQPSEEVVATMHTMLTSLPHVARGIPVEGELLRDSEYYQAQLTKLRIQEDRANPGLAVALGLSEDETNQLFTAIGRSQLDLAGELLGPTQRPSPEAAWEAVKRQGTSQEQVIRNQLGETRYALLQDYRKNIRPAQIAVRDMADTLSAAGLPLSDYQTRSLGNVVQGELKRQQAAMASGDRRNSTVQSIEGLVNEVQDRQDRQAENRRQLLAAVTSWLNPEQIALLRKRLDQETGATRAALEELAR